MSHATAGSGIFFLLQMNGQYSTYLLLSVRYFVPYLLPAWNCKGGALELSKKGKKGKGVSVHTLKANGQI
jgi:hypothetical protein